MANTFDDLKSSYRPLFDSMTINAERVAEVDRIIDRIVQFKSVYQTIMDSVGVPWQVVAAIHSLEASLNMTRHLHNGDPLTARTVHVPAGRPLSGEPPFTFADSASDALKMKHLDQIRDWSLERILYTLEAYNGFGSRSHGINSPYLWSFSNQYTKGKYVADNVYDPEAVSQQAGAAVILKRMIERNLFSVAALPRPVEVSLPGQQVAGIYLQNTVWVPVRKVAELLGAFQIDAVRMSPLIITVSASGRIANLEGQLIVGSGYVRAHDLFETILGLKTTFDPALATLKVEKVVRALTPAIAALEDRLKAAMLAGNVNELENLLSDGLLFTNHLGQEISKADDLEVHRSGRLKFNSIDILKEESISVGDTTIVAVHFRMTGTFDGHPLLGEMRITRVWADGQVAAAHSSMVTA